jgi:uncharacterized protein (DUF1499 family)
MSLILASLLYPLNDITTTFQNPPVFVAIARLPEHKQADLTYKDSNRVRQQKLYPDLAPLSLSQNQTDIFKRVVAQANALSGWKVIQTDEKAFRLEATVTSALFKFIDDFVVEVRAEGSGCSVHARSKSRVGRSDLSANYSRIRDFLNHLK